MSRNLAYSAFEPLLDHSAILEEIETAARLI
jgi:hypothetical protein